MVEDFSTQFQVETNMPAVLVMESSTHFREVLNEMLEVRKQTELEENSGLKPEKSPRLPPIYLTDEELKDFRKENENSSRNIGKLFINLQTEEQLRPSLNQIERQSSQELLETKDSTHLNVPVGELDVKSSLQTRKEQGNIRVLELNALKKAFPGK